LVVLNIDVSRLRYVGDGRCGDGTSELECLMSCMEMVYKLVQIISRVVPKEKNVINITPVVKGLVFPSKNMLVLKMCHK